MEINEYLGRVREGVENAVSLADDNTKDVASRLTTSIEPAVRLVIIDALGDAATEISDQLGDTRVAMQLRDGEPEFVLDHDSAYADDEYDEDADLDEADTTDDEGDFDDEQVVLDDEQVRFSLRLPRWAKEKIDERAERAGVSVNSYLTMLVLADVVDRRGGGRGRGPRRDGPRADAPPFGPGGPFGQNPFGPGGPAEQYGPVIAEAARFFSETFGKPGRYSADFGNPFDGSRGGGPRRGEGGPGRRGPRGQGRGEHRRRHDGHGHGGACGSGEPRD